MKTHTALLVAASAAVAMSAATASAATYVINATVSTAGLSCSSAHDIETCVSAPTFETPFPTLNNGDTYTLNLTFDTPLFVPGSKTEDIVFDELIDFNGVVGSIPAYTANVSSTLVGYVGSPLGYSAYSSADYIASAGFGFGSGGLPNKGFTLTGIDSTFHITESDPNEIVGFDFGFQIAAPEPTTWAMMIAGFAGLGGALRFRRARPATA